MDVDGIADYTRSTPMSVRQQVHLRQIPFIKRGRRVLFDRLEIDAWLAKQRVPVSP
jgi:excisionase family DNA binding protein